MTTEPITEPTFAWRVHDTLEEWRARADRKAAILLSFQGGAAAVAITQTSHPFGWLEYAASAAIVSALIATAMVVLPALGRAGRSDADLIYFGHLRHWSADDLTTKLTALSSQDEIDMLSRQLVALSSIVWRMHRLLQLSVLLTLLATGLAVAAVTTDLLAR